MDLVNLTISNMNKGVFFRITYPGEVAAINISNVVIRNSDIGLVAQSGADATTLHTPHHARNLGDRALN